MTRKTQHRYGNMVKTWRKWQWNSAFTQSIIPTINTRKEVDSHWHPKEDASSPFTFYINVTSTFAHRPMWIRFHPLTKCDSGWLFSVVWKTMRKREKRKENRGRERKRKGKIERRKTDILCNRGVAPSQGHKHVSTQYGTKQTQDSWNKNYVHGLHICVENKPIRKYDNTFYVGMGQVKRWSSVYLRYWSSSEKTIANGPKHL